MSWDEEIRELKAREALAHEMGGADKVARQHEFGKLTIRERIATISDPDSFHEVGALAGVGRYADLEESGFFGPHPGVRARAGTAGMSGRGLLLWTAD